MSIPKICSIPDCGKPHHSRGFCSLHYQRLRKYGDAAFSKEGHLLAFMEQAIQHTDEASCLLWPFRSVNGGGYPVISIEHKTHIVHRIICTRVHGDPPTTYHQAAHKCGVRNCCNPHHHYWATPKQNSADRIEHGTSARGEGNARAKLTEQDVALVRASPMGGSALARMLGVSKSTVSHIRCGRTWLN